jgi:hypothetical protein
MLICSSFLHTYGGPALLSAKTKLCILCTKPRLTPAPLSDGQIHVGCELDGGNPTAL